jgi:predicted nucleotidyltransferase
LQKGTANDKSDVDIAVIVKGKKDTKEINDKFLNDISVRFYSYFNAHLDAYIKTKDEFRSRLQKNQPPISTLMKSYSIIYGKEPLEI